MWLVMPHTEDVFLRYVSLVIDCVTGSLPNYNKPILVIGDSGVGKGLFIEAARQVMLDFAKDNKCFCRVNCASFEKNLAESELFGHKKGSFTGATEDKVGIVASANDGLLVLDEIGELPLEVQAKLLIFIEEKRYRPIGSTRDYPSDVKIIGITNKQKESFREDFWYRFFPVFIPPLHEHRADVLYYVGHKYPDVFRRLTSQHLLSMLAHNWPGNVREIERVISIMTFEDSYLSKQEKYLASKGFEYKKKDSLFFPEDARQTSLSNIYLHEFYKNLQKKCYPIDLLNSIIKDFGLEFPECALSVEDIVERNNLLRCGVVKDYFNDNEDVELDNECVLEQGRLDGQCDDPEVSEPPQPDSASWPVPRTDIKIRPCDHIYPFKNIYRFDNNQFIEDAAECFTAICNLFLRDEHGSQNVFDFDKYCLNTSPWEHSLVQDIMRVFHECGLIKVSLEYIAGSRLKFTGKFSLKFPWHRYVERVLLDNRNKFFGDKEADDGKSIFNDTEREILRKYYSYLRNKYRTVRDASKHAGMNESTFRNRLRRYGLLPCQTEGDGSVE